MNDDRGPHPDLVIDATGQLCPLPIIELAKAARSLGTGLIELRADDPAALADVPAWCSMRAAELVSVAAGERAAVFLVRLGQAPSRQPG